MVLVAVIVAMADWIDSLLNVIKSVYRGLCAHLVVDSAGSESDFESACPIPPEVLDAYENMVEFVYRDFLMRDAYSEDSFTLDSAPAVLELMRQVLRDLDGLTQSRLQSTMTTQQRSVTLVDSTSGYRSLGGRPNFDIQKDQLSSLLDSRFTVVQIAEIIGVSRRTVFRRMSEFDLSVRSTYSDLTDDELDHIINQIKLDFPTCGNKQMIGHLASQGIKVQQSRVQESMRRVDPEGCVDRRIGLMKRRKYRVSGPRSLYHIDGNHKLIR